MPCKRNCASTASRGTSNASTTPICRCHPVASCVVFRDGKPARKDYRHFNIKTVEGPDDYASMREVVFRRYSRLQEEGRAARSHYC